MRWELCRWSTLAPPVTQTPEKGLSGADRRAAEKEVSAIDRRLAKLAEAIKDAHIAFAAHDQSDYVGLAAEQEKLAALERESAELEERWLELSETLEG